MKQPLWQRVARIAGRGGALTLLCFATPLVAAHGGGPSYTTEQADRGQARYEHSCQTCHGSTLDNGDFGGAPLNGSWFKTHWGSGDVAALFQYVKSAMPPDNPGSLNDTTIADILAFILKGNDYAAGATELPPDPDALSKMSLKR